MNDDNTPVTRGEIHKLITELYKETGHSYENDPFQNDRDQAIDIVAACIARIFGEELCCNTCDHVKDDHVGAPDGTWCIATSCRCREFEPASPEGNT